ncbi:MAG: NAD-glutamate dehydrogenase domain-containing protein [Alphaproteobacteria bacterium]
MKTSAPTLPTALATWLKTTPATTRADAAAVAALTAPHAPSVQVVINASNQAFTIHIYSTHAQLTLAEMMPVVHSFRLEAIREDVFHHRSGKQQLWLHVLTCANPSQPVSGTVADELAKALTACLLRTTEVDSLNSLTRKGVPFAALHVLRALVAYASQLDGRCNPWQMRKVLRHYPAVAKHLWEIFDARHNPAYAPHARTKLVHQLEGQTRELWATLPDVDHDRMASLMLEMIQASLRTNFWQGAGAALAFKFDCSLMDSMPTPRPWREMFVYGGAEFEGVHLRGGPLARGGIRHSDRLTDYRTEVLGLQQTQVRKNVIIVPTGAKGGFVVKMPLPPQRAEAHTAIRNVYAAYVNAMLSITDTRAGDAVVHPRNVVCHDGFDPYFVVAADKGTATFSDLANTTAIAADFWDKPTKNAAKGFWLGDAFASGGALGYDHKEMGITSRGAWVSVQHHLQTLGVVPSAKTPITMTGIGDMSGDVFGNGLLRCPHVKLLAAFNHKHIFLDPTPTPATSYAERTRMFTAKLGWDGYNTKLISAGGGVLERSAKTVPLSPQAQKLLGIDSKEAAPDTVIQAILRLEVDVLWNGGIGTYIKATTESHADVADRANDAVRVNAKDVQARVIGEGGNLGITPKGRTELALNGVRLNTDALDNSAGVSTSDHEVNVKILLEDAKARKLLTEPQRLKLLPTLTEDLAHLVLDDNRLQNMALTLSEKADTADHADMYAWQLEMLKRGLVDVKVDNLPTADILKQRDKPHFVRPELAALLAGTKAALRSQIAGKLDYTSPLLQDMLMAYFPATLQQQFASIIPHHPLANEMMDTLVSNMIINRCGLVMGQRLQADFGCTPQDAIKARLAAISLLGLVPFWAKFDALAPTLPMATQVEAALRWRVSIFTLAGWILAHGQPVEASRWGGAFEAECHKLYKTMARLLPPTMLADTGSFQKQWAKQGLTPALAEKLGHLSASTMVPQAVVLAQRHKAPPSKVLELLMALGEELHLPAITRKLRGLPLTDKHSRSAMYAMEREIQARQARLTEQLLVKHMAPTNWHKACGAACQRYQTIAREFTKLANPTLTMAAVLLGRLRELDVA